MNTRSYILSIVFILFGFSSLLSQDPRLANQYFNNGEYEKAAQEFKALFDQSRGSSDYYFNKYIRALLSLEEYETCIKEIKQQIKKRPNHTQLLVTYGSVYEMLGDFEKAEKQYRTAIEKVPNDRNNIIRLGNSFISYAKYEMAILVFEKGEKVLNDKDIFSNQLADLYRRKGDGPKMIHYYLNSIDQNDSRINTLKNIFQRYLSEEDFNELKKQLYQRIQKFPESIKYPELLTWTFVHDKEYGQALRQAKSLDARLEENGARVFNIGRIASNDESFDTAIEAFDYIAQTKEKNSSYYIAAKRELLRNKRLKLVSNPQFDKSELSGIELEYEKFLSEFGKNGSTANIIIEYAELQSFHLNNNQMAIELLSELINKRGINNRLVAMAKLDLADYYLIENEVWESTLLYSQVDKAFKEDQLGEMARYKNAKLSYYAGDFDWAQEQFDILKASTSKLISNDAIDMSVFILDNFGLDTTAATLELYANADLLIVQNKYEEAFKIYDQINTEYPNHSLDDDILYVKANVFNKQKQYDKAITAYNEIIQNYPEEIRCDNAMFELADLYELLDQKDKAKELYERIFIDYSNSTFAVEARKRYRILRGDEIQ